MNSSQILIPGDGVGPECVHAAQRIVEASGAAVAWEERHAAGGTMLLPVLRRARMGAGSLWALRRIRVHPAFSNH